VDPPVIDYRRVPGAYTLSLSLSLCLSYHITVCLSVQWILLVYMEVIDVSKSVNQIHIGYYNNQQIETSLAVFTGCTTHLLEIVHKEDAQHQEVPTHQQHCEAFCTR